MVVALAGWDVEPVCLALAAAIQEAATYQKCHTPGRSRAINRDKGRSVLVDRRAKKRSAARNFGLVANLPLPKYSQFFLKLNISLKCSCCMNVGSAGYYLYKGHIVLSKQVCTSFGIIFLFFCGTASCWWISHLLLKLKSMGHVQDQF